jgi:hypothetical protein
MVTKDELVLVESVGGVDGPPTFEDVTTNSSHMENVHLKLGKSLEMKYYSLQLHKFKLHFGNHTIVFQFSRVLFLMNDDFPMDLENLQMLQCNVMSQNVFLKKGLIKYNKLIGLLP